MIVQYLLRSWYACCPVLLVVLLAGCSKNGQPLEEPEFSGIYLQAITADPFRLKVLDGEKELTNGLLSPGNRLTVLSTYYDPLHRIRVYDFYGNALLLDTLMPFRGNPYTITFYQDKPGDQLRWIGPPVNEPFPPDGSIKLSIVYTAPLLPASMKVVVENAGAESGSQYAATDSFVLNKGAFSPYFLSRNLRTQKCRLQLYSAGPERKLLSTVAPDHFLATNPDFSIFLFDKASGSSVFTLESKKLY